MCWFSSQMPMNIPAGDKLKPAARRSIPNLHVGGGEPRTAEVACCLLGCTWQKAAIQRVARMQASQPKAHAKSRNLREMNLVSGIAHLGCYSGRNQSCSVRQEPGACLMRWNGEYRNLSLTGRVMSPANRQIPATHVGDVT